MNLFRSEEHVRSWTGFDPAAAGGIIPLSDVLKLFSGEFFQKRLSLDYVSRSPDLVNGFVAAVREIARTRPFWAPEGH